MFVEITSQLNKRGRFIEKKDLRKYFQVFNGSEFYKSYFEFDNQIIEHLKTGKRSAAGYIGKFYLNQIILDIDAKETFDETVSVTREVVNKLIKDFDLEDNFQIWFSGRGFHIHMPDIFGFEPSNKLPAIVRETIGYHFPEADTKPIQPRGLIRVGYSLNKKSKLHKIPIRESEIWFLTEKQIKQWDKDERKIELIRPKDYGTYHDLIQFPKEQEVGKMTLLKPNRIVTCMQHCYNTGPVKGTRHERLLRMSSWWKRNGIPLKGAVAMANEWIGKEEYEFKKAVIDTYNKEYAFGCNDKIMKQFCDAKCIHYKNKDFTSQLESASNLEKSFASYIRGGWQEQSINLAPILNLSVKEFWVQPEDIVGIVGGTGLNKTALAQNVALALEKFEPVLYCSTEFSNIMLFRRFIQIKYAMTKQEVIAYYEKEDNHLSQGLSHLKFTKVTPTFNGLEHMIKMYRPRVMFIDVIDDIVHNAKGGTEGESLVGKGIKDLARKYRMIIFYVHHISKGAAFDEKGNPKRLTIHSGKGSSTIEQKSDLVFGIEGRQENNMRVVRSLKARDNEPFTNAFVVGKDTFIFRRNYIGGNGESNSK